MRWAAAILVATFATSAMAQTETAPIDTVTAHYRDYQEALEQGDLASAEAAAAAALAASEARDGDGGHTAVLAMNLAHVRLDRRMASEALAPARRALNLAEAHGADSGVDPLTAMLALGRAELVDDGDEGSERLIAALEEAQTRTDIHGEAYEAAIDLAAWAASKEKWRIMRSASAAAGRHAEDGDIGPLARVAARSTEGIALVMLRQDRQAYVILTEALNLCRPLTRDPSLADEMTVAETQCYHTMAWRTALGARMRSGRRRSTGTRIVNDDYEDTFGRESSEGGDSAGRSQRCDVRVVPEPLPAYPREALRRLGVGAVIVRLKINGNGLIEDIRIAGVAPGVGGFREAVEAVMHQWRIERLPTSPADCRMEMTASMPISFVIR